MITLSTLTINYRKNKISEKKFNILKYFFASLYANINDIVKNKELCPSKINYNKVKVNDDKLGYGYEYDIDINVSILLEGYHREIFGSECVTLKLPGVKDGVLIEDKYIYRLIVLPLVREGFWDDEYYNFLKPILKTLPLYYNQYSGKVGFSVDSFRELNNKNTSIKLGQDGFKEVSPNELLSTEVSQGFINKDIGDPERDYGFTHRIREMLGMKFFQWQNKVVTEWNKINIVFAVRNSGKTAFACYIGLREIVSEKNGFGIRKNRKIIYFVPDKVDIGEQVMDYMVGYIDSMFNVSMKEQTESESFKSKSSKEQENIRYKLSEQIKKLKRTYFSIDRSKFSIKCNITGNSFKVVSLSDIIGKSGKELGTSKGEGLACDVYIIDEAPRIPDVFWNSFWERAETESEYGYISGTLNQETPKNHWAYKLALDGELGNKDISTHRIALWDNENLFFGVKTLEDKKIIIERERNKLLKAGGLKNLYCRGYGIILNENKVFNISGCIKSEIDKGEKFHTRVIIIDFGGDSDPIAMIVYNINTMFIEKNILLKGLDIDEQLKLVEDERKRYKHIFTLGDGTGVGRLARSRDLNSVIDYYITFSSGPTWKYNKDKGYYAVDKSYMVDLCKGYFNKTMFKFTNNDEELIDHINNFIKITDSNARVQQYEAKKGKHDDLVACLLMLSAFLTEGLGLIEADKLKDFGIEAINSLDYINDLRDNGDNNLYYNGFY